MQLPANTASPTPTAIRSGNASVIASGSVIAFDAVTPIEIEFVVKDGAFALILEQSIDAANPNPRYEIKGAEGNPQRVRVRVFNLQGTPLGSFPSAARVWTGPDNSIFLQLRYFSVPESSPLFHYTIYLKPEPNKGA
jgi:hypothetical protein